MIRYFFVLVSIFSGTALHGQLKSYCNDVSKEQVQIDEERVNQFIRTSGKEWRSEGMDTIILSPVIIKSQTTGVQPIEIEVLDNAIEALNEYFDFTDIIFKYCGEPRILDNDKYYNLTIAEAIDLNAAIHEENTINIYIAETVSEVYSNGDVGLFCGISSFPKPESKERYILLDGSCLSDPSLLAHEIGHFYGLFHTHETSFGAELVSKINCEIAGDLLCDTPADPLLNPSNVAGCRYNGDELDPEGDAYRPDTKNVMSYSPENCRNKFSWQQLFKILSVHQNENKYLRENCDFPDFEVKVDTFFASFIPGQKIQLPIVISNTGWIDTYGLGVKAFFSDSPDNKKSLLTSSKILFPPNLQSLSLRLNISLPIDLPESIQYLIIEIDGDQKISELNENNNTATLAYKLDYSQLPDLSLYPNPARENVRVFLRGISETGPVTIDILDSSGKRIKSFNRHKSFDTFQAEIDVSNFINGLYFVKVNINDHSELGLKLLKM